MAYNNIQAGPLIPDYDEDLEESFLGLSGQGDPDVEGYNEEYDDEYEEEAQLYEDAYASGGVTVSQEAGDGHQRYEPLANAGDQPHMLAPATGDCVGS